MDQKVKFITDVLSGDYTMTELCHVYQISRKTGYKWWNRYAFEGSVGLEDRSRAPLHHPNGITSRVERLILEMRNTYPYWGPLKLVARLHRKYPRQHDWPAASSVGALLQRHGLVRQRRKRRGQATPSRQPLTEINRINQVWGADFKGWFQVGDGTRCDPLTITDQHSRFILCCQQVGSPQLLLAKSLFTRVFRQYGLPRVIRTDNGIPFASKGLGGLSQLSAWWIRLGIFPERIEPGKPYQNGRHERMHLTLKQQTAQPPARTLRTQQKRFDRFQKEFNYERPHEALSWSTPGSIYQSSPRTFPSRLPSVDYPDEMTVRKVQHHGDISLAGQRIFIGEAFFGEYVGLEKTDNDLSQIWYCDYLLGTLNHRTNKVTPHRPGPDARRKRNQNQTPKP